MPAPTHGPTSGAPAGAAGPATAAQASTQGKWARGLAIANCVFTLFYCLCGGGLSFAIDYTGVAVSAVMFGTTSLIIAGITTVLHIAARKSDPDDDSAKIWMIVGWIAWGANILVLIACAILASVKVANIG